MSADILDDASEREQRDRDSGLAHVRQELARQRQATVIYHTHCAWCHEHSPDGRAYCSYGRDSCAADAQRERDIKRRQRA